MTTKEELEGALAALADAGRQLDDAQAETAASASLISDVVQRLTAVGDAVGAAEQAVNSATDRVEAAMALLAEVPGPPDPPDPPAPTMRDVVQVSGPAWTGPFPVTSPGASGNWQHLKLFTGPAVPWRQPFGRSVPTGDVAKMFPGAGAGEVRVEMKPSDFPLGQRGLATNSLDAWLPFDRRHKSAGFGLDLFLPNGWSWPKTFKWGGLVAWDGDWPTWPGGGRPTGRNCSVRLTGNDVAQSPGGVASRLAAYLYLGGVWTGKESVEGGRIGWVANDNHTVEIHLEDFGSVPTGRWIPLRYEAETGDDGVGTLTVKADGLEVLHVAGLRWFTDPSTLGWNLGYLCNGFGGETDDFNPKTLPPWSWNWRNARWFHREPVS